jgi:hypothetical protein
VKEHPMNIMLIVWDQEPSKLGGGKELSTHEQSTCNGTATIEQKDQLEQKKY